METKKSENARAGCEKCNYRGYSIIDGQVISCEHCRCPECGCPATHPSGLCRDCHQAVLETDARACVNIPVCLGYTREEMIETYPRLSIDEIDEILNAAYDLQVGFDLAAGKFVSVETVTYYFNPETKRV